MCVTAENKCDAHQNWIKKLQCYWNFANFGWVLRAQIKLCCFSPRKKWCLKKSTGTFFSQRDFQKSTGKVGGHIKHLSNFLYNSFMKLVFWLSNYQNMVKRGKKERKRSKPWKTILHYTSLYFTTSHHMTSVFIEPLSYLAIQPGPRASFMLSL